jgi:hypothetical protein
MQGAYMRASSVHTDCASFLSITYELMPYHPWDVKTIDPDPRLMIFSNDVNLAISGSQMYYCKLNISDWFTGFYTWSREIPVKLICAGNQYVTSSKAMANPINVYQDDLLKEFHLP